MSVAATSSELEHSLAAQLGPEAISSDPAAIEAATIDEVAPRAVVSPQNAEQVAALLRVCNEKDWPVIPMGGRTRLRTGGIPESYDIALSLRRMDRILSYDAGDLTISLEAGCTLEQLRAATAASSQMLPIDAAPEETIGGILASAASGPLRHGFGTVRDFCIGVSFITGDGLAGRGGGRVVKNVAGYDLMKLLIGSYGTLGVITSANFRLFPALRQTRTFACDFAGADEAVAFAQDVARSPLQPIALEIVSPNSWEYLQGQGHTRDPDHHAPGTSPQYHPWTILVCASGSDAVLARYSRELGSAVSWQLGGSDESALWAHINSLTEAITRQHRNAMIFRLSVTPNEVANALAAAQAVATDYNFICSVVGRVGLGALVAAFSPMAVDPPGAMSFASAASALRSRLPLTATVMVTQCPTEAKRHFETWGTPTVDAELMRSVKQALDPRNVLSPGRWI